MQSLTRDETPPRCHWSGRETGDIQKYELGDVSAEKGVRKWDAEKADIEGMSRVMNLARKRAIYFDILLSSEKSVDWGTKRREKVNVWGREK